MSKLGFVGIDTKDEKEKEQYFNNLDNFQIKKIDFLNYMKYKTDTKFFLWRMYVNHIHPQEKLLNKDLMFFTSEEISDFATGKFQNRESYRRSMLNFTSQYMQYGINVTKQIQVNSASFINIAKLTKNKPKVLKKIVWGLDEFYEKIWEISAIMTINDTIPLLLARYGVMGKDLDEMLNLKWGDVDLENNVISIIDHSTGELKKQYYTDNRFSDYMREYKEECEYNYNDDFVLMQKYAKDRADVYKATGLRNITYNIAKKMEENRISYKDLSQSRKIDYLLSIRSNRKLLMKDIEFVNKLISPNVTLSINFTLKTFWESLTGDKVHLIKGKNASNVEDLIDSNSKEYVEEICENIDFSFPKDIDLNIFKEESQSNNEENLDDKNKSEMVGVVEE